MLTSRHLFAVGKFPKPAMPDWFVCFYGWHVTGENVFFVHSGSGSTSLSLTLNWPITYILRASKRQFTTLHYDDDQLHWRTSCPSRSVRPIGPMTDWGSAWCNGVCSLFCRTKRKQLCRFCRLQCRDDPIRTVGWIWPIRLLGWW